jgi:hypothetical protein
LYFLRRTSIRVEPRVAELVWVSESVVCEDHSVAIDGQSDCSKSIDDDAQMRVRIEEVLIEQRSWAMVEDASDA